MHPALEDDMDEAAGDYDQLHFRRKAILDLLHTLGLLSNIATQSATLVKGSYN